jgi:hypothetical protein
MTVPENTLHIKDLSIVKTSEFLDKFKEKSLIMWGSDVSTMFFIPQLLKYEIIESSSNNEYDEDIGYKIVFTGRGKEAIFFKNCFGFVEFEKQEKYWVDSFNEKEMVIISYCRNYKDYSKILSDEVK